MNDNEVDYSENEGDQKMIKRFFKRKKKRSLLKK